MSIRFSKAIVVGASSGIGAAIALELAARGADVAILARRTAELERVAAAQPGRLKAYAHDVTDFGAVPALFDRVVRELGGLDLLVYASGISRKPAAGKYDFELERATIEVNLLGAMAWLNPAAAYFDAAHCGTIVGISSVAGERGRRGAAAYAVSKAALSTYLEALRNRCSRYGVNVVTAKLGYVDTAMTRDARHPFWMISAEQAAREVLALAARGSSPSGFVPPRWAVVACLLRTLPSRLFRQLDV